MRLTFGERDNKQSRGGTQGAKPIGIIEQARGVRFDELAFEAAEVLGQAAPPPRRDRVAGLQQGASARRLAAAHQPGMPPVLAGQQFDDQPIFAVPPPAQHKTGVAPVHCFISGVIAKSAAPKQSR